MSTRQEKHMRKNREK